MQGLAIAAEQKDGWKREERAELFYKPGAPKDSWQVLVNP
jgi:hypothetical protein